MLTNSAKILIIGTLSSAVIIIYIGLASIPFNPLNLSYNQKTSIFTLIPQGWGFFTRNPREDEQYIYKKINNKWVLFSFTNSDPVNCLGASRIGRKINFEAYHILSIVKDTTIWGKTRSIQFETNLFDKIPTSTIINPVNNPTLIGEFVFIKRRKVPWAWSHFYYSLAMPSKLLHVLIKRDDTSFD